jgi:hypothetical protein
VVTELQRLGPGGKYTLVMRSNIAFRRPNLLAVRPSSGVGTINCQPADPSIVGVNFGGVVCDGTTVRTLGEDGALRASRRLTEKETQFEELWPELDTHAQGGLLLGLLVSPDPYALLKRFDLRYQGAVELDGTNCDRIQLVDPQLPKYMVLSIESGPTPRLRAILIRATNARILRLEDGAKIDRGDLQLSYEACTNWEMEPEFEKGVFQVSSELTGDEEPSEPEKAGR